MTPGAARSVDCDVHGAVGSVENLFPYLEDHWRGFFGESGFANPLSVETTYPSWSAMLATGGEAATLEGVRADVLSDDRLAIVNVYYGPESFTHPYLAPAVATAVNRWLVAEWLDRESRLLGSAVVAPQFADAAVAEIERVAADPRIVQLMLPAASWDPYGHQRYWPIWEAAERHGLALALTYGGAAGTGPSPMGWMSSLFEDYAVGTQAFQAHLASIVMSGVLDAHPGLKIVVQESGWTWMPAFMWKLDAEWKAFRREVPWLTAPPSEYMRRHVRITTHPTDGPGGSAQIDQILNQLGSEEMLMFGSDHPHRYGTAADDLLARLDPDQLARVMWSNAADCYGLEQRLGALR